MTHNPSDLMKEPQPHGGAFFVSENGWRVCALAGLRVRFITRLRRRRISPQFANWLKRANAPAR